MKVISDTKQERLITLELTEKELITLWSALGATYDSERIKLCKKYSVEGLDSSNSTNLYSKLGNLLGLRW